MAPRRTSPPDFHAALPDPALWLAPIAWAGSPPSPVENYSRFFPDHAVFVRAEVIVALQVDLSPGVSRSIHSARPALLRLSNGTPTEISLVGFDGRCWSLRANAVTRRPQWSLFVGSNFPVTELAPIDLFQTYKFERFIVQSLLPSQRTGRFLSFAFTDTLYTETFPTLEPEPAD